MKKLIWLLLAAPLVLASCKKESDSNPSPVPGSSACVITEERDSANNALTSSYEYDASRRVIKQFNYSNGVKSDYSTFTYSGSTITIQQYSMNNTVDGNPLIATLSSAGYVSTLISVGPDTVDNIPGISRDTINFSYNSSGQMLSYNNRYWFRDLSNNIISQYSNSLTFEYASGRVSKQINTFSGPGFTSTSTDVLTYDENSPLVTSNPVVGLFALAGSELFGKLQSNRIPVKIETSSEQGGQTNTKTITYAVDSKGNPTKIRIVSSGSPIAVTSLYNYNCP